MEMLLKNRKTKRKYIPNICLGSHLRIAVARLLPARKEFERFLSTLGGSGQCKKKDRQIPIIGQLHQPQRKAYTLATRFYAHKISNQPFTLTKNN